MEEINTVSNVASENVDFSMLALFMSADLVVKSVILISVSYTHLTLPTKA